jgi:tetratricopeptide (TPR) repeat protein
MIPAPAPALARLQQAAGLQRQGLHGDALPLLREVVVLAPEFAPGWEALGVGLKDCGHYAEAVEAFARALQLGHPRPHEILLHRAVLFADHLRRDGDAHEALQRALELQPDYLPALLNLGNLHEQRGERSEALACYERVLEQPDIAYGPHAALRGVALARSAVIAPPASLDDPGLQVLQAAARNETDPMVRVHLHFALGHTLDRIGQTAAAFEAFALGNRGLQRVYGRRYDRRHEQQLNDLLMQIFASPSAADSAEVDTRTRAGPVPLFICGMFRSGSTLIEQVLAAHTGVVAGGEIDWLLRLAAERMAPFPASARLLDGARASALGREYRAELGRLFPHAHADSYITDKRPDNFQIIGLIKRLLPTVKIIHTVRHPVDNGLSVFMQHMNTQVTPYATDLRDIGHYYGEYRRLMAHWKRLYPDDILDFDYDAFVREPEAHLRRLLAFLDLPWEPACLEFHSVRNTVKTASYWQVRQPLYGNASGRWKRYLPQLGPLLESLREAGVHWD